MTTRLRLALLAVGGLAAAGESRPLPTKQMEPLNRGAVAIRQDAGYFLTWRLLGTDPYDTGFHVHRDGARLTDSPLAGATAYLDLHAPTDSVYTVRAVVDGIERPACKPARLANPGSEHAGFFDIPLVAPAPGPEGGRYTPNDASAGDLTGDGDYDLVLKWQPDNARDNAHAGRSDPVFLDAYTLDGVKLWRINLGVNIRAGSHYTQFLVFDFDGDGRAEVMVKTAPGTRDGRGRLLADGPAATADHSRDYRNPSGYVLEGPEFLTVFDGATGRELATAPYWPERGVVRDWGDAYGNRVDRFNATVAYVDGHRPSAIFQRGYYTRMTLAAWDWRDGRLSRRWTFDSDDPGHAAYAGQGNHALHVIDADQDGRHDIVTGSAVIGSDGQGMHTTGRGHGDAAHATHMIKDFPFPQIFMVYESGGHGMSLRHAHDATLLFQHPQARDVGRGCAAALDASRPGFHFWGAGRMGLYDIAGAVVGQPPRHINFVVWWDVSG